MPALPDFDTLKPVAAGPDFESLRPAVPDFESLTEEEPIGRQFDLEPSGSAGIPVNRGFRTIGEDLTRTQDLETPPELKTILAGPRVLPHAWEAVNKPFLPISKLTPSARTVQDALDALASSSPELTQEEAQAIEESHAKPGATAKVTAGVLGGVNRAAEGLTTPLSIGTLGTAALPGWIGRIVSGLFAADMASKAPAEYQRLKDAVASGDEEAIAGAATDLAATGAFTGAAGLHAVRPTPKPAGERPPPPRPPAGEQPVQGPVPEPPPTPPADTSADALRELEAALRGNQLKPKESANEPANESQNANLEQTSRPAAAPTPNAPPGQPIPEAGRETAQQGPVARGNEENRATGAVEATEKGVPEPGEQPAEPAPAPEPRAPVGPIAEIKPADELTQAEPPKAGLPQPEAASTPAEAPPAEAPKPDRVESFLDSLKADTGPDQLHAFGLIPEVWNGLIETVRLAYRAGRSIQEAISDGLEWLHRQHPGQLSNESLLREHLEKGLLRPYDELKQRREAIAKRLEEIAATPVGPGESLPADLRAERYHLARESLNLDRELLRHPQHVEHLILEAERLADELAAARQAGDAEKARAAADQLQAISEGDLARVDPKLYEHIRNELESGGRVRALPGEIGAGRTLADLVRWLDSNKLDSPKLTLGERFNLAKRLADEWDRGKSALTKAADRVGATWKSFTEQFRHPPLDTDVRSLFKQWFFEKQVTGLETDRWVRRIEAEMPRPERRAGLAIWLQAHGNMELLRAQFDLVPPKFKRIWRAALDLTAKERALGHRIRQDFETKLEDAMRMGLLEKGREDYGVPQIWDVLPKTEGPFNPDQRSARKMTAKLDPRDPFFALRRTVPTYFDGIMAGGIPKTLDIGRLVGLYNFDFHNVLADRGVIWALRNATMPDGLPAVKISGGAKVLPRGEATEGGRAIFVDSKKHSPNDVTADGRPYRSIDHWALRDWKVATTTESGNPVIVRGDFLVHPDVYRFIKNELGTSWLRDPEGGGKYFNPILNSAAFLKASKFASASFHMATLAEHSMFHAVSGRPTAERLSLLWPSVRGFEMDPGKNPELAGLMRHGMETGFGGGRELFEEGLASHGGIWGHIPGLGDMMTKLSTFLFKDYMPRLKAKTALVIFHSNMERYGGKLSRDQILELSARQANAAFGAQNWRLLGTNKTLLDINRLFLTAPDFLLSRAKVVAQAIKPYNAEQKYFLIAQAVILYGMARALNYVLDDDPHWEPDQAFRVNYNGRSYAGRFLVQDLAHMVSEPMAFASGRLGPIPRSAIEALTGREMMTGAPKRVPFKTDNKTLRAALIFAQDVGEWLIPMGAEGFLPGAKSREQTGPGQVALSLAGIGSRKLTAETRIRELAQDFSKEHGFARDPQYAEFWGGPYSDLTRALGNGDTDAARDAMQDLLKVKTPQQVLKHYADWINAPYTGRMDREGQFFRNLEPEQRQAYLKSRETRRELAREAYQLLRGMAVGAR